ncbi:MAG: hypothetical protein CVU13_00490 [Bacteroidetes bacterium HGW-Bacteroidetes-8]|nr:MAG: hypothetical protein CVU13_00490 [Bacteroidetes bacterium HGW-Bacteroidetes-8]
MKNTITIIVPIILGLILSSCGTTTRYASSGYEDAIYQKPSTNGYIVVNTENDSKIELLKGKTKESNRVIINGKVVEAAYVDENGNVNINLDDQEEKTYLILNPGESFEERLTKFENPQYQINITYSYMDFDNPWFWDFGYNRYYWHMGRMGRMALRNPWYSYFMSPWFGSGFYGDNYYHSDPYAGILNWWWSTYYMQRSPWDCYYSSWYYPGFNEYGYWYYNWNDPQRYRYTSSRDFYYGRRESARSNTPTSSRAVVSGGSYTRQSARVEQVRGARFYTGDISSSESQYRRDSRFEGYGSSTNSQAREVSGQRRGNTESTSRVERESSSRRSSEITRGTEVNRGSNNTQSSVRRSNNEGARSSGTVNRSTGTINRSTGTVNRSTGTVNRSTGTVNRSTSTTSRSTGTVNRSSGSSTRRDDVISSSNYRPSENQRSSSSNNNTFTRGSSSGTNSGYYNNSNSSRGSVYTPPASSSSGSSSSANTSSSSSAGSSSNTSSSGSSYRR